MTAERIPELPTDRHFLDLSETCLYMVHFGLWPFFRKSQKIVYIGLLKVNQKVFLKERRRLLEPFKDILNLYVTNLKAIKCYIWALTGHIEICIRWIPLGTLKSYLVNDGVHGTINLKKKNMKKRWRISLSVSIKLAKFYLWFVFPGLYNDRSKIRRPKKW